MKKNDEKERARRRRIEEYTARLDYSIDALTENELKQFEADLDAEEPSEAEIRGNIEYGCEEDRYDCR